MAEVEKEEELLSQLVGFFHPLAKDTFCLHLKKSLQQWWILLLGQTTLRKKEEKEK